MTSEEIIQRLLDDRKITVKEAMTLMRDICKNFLFNKEESPSNFPPTVVMYGVRPVDYRPETIGTTGTTTTISSINSNYIKEKE